MLSKMAKPETITYKELLKIDLEKTKLPELKKFAKDLNMKTTGKKQEIKERIVSYIKTTDSAVKIQKTFRKYMVCLWMKLKGTRENCVNDSDFYTLEPLNEIPYIYYIKYEDNSHNYGFDIKSLCIMVSKNNKFENPYNREKLKTEFGHKLTKVIKLTNILFPQNDLYFEKNMIEQPRQQMQTPPVFMTMDQRINQLFSELDRLGNYTNREWFTSLIEETRFVLVVRINQLWHRIPSTLRSQICPNISPFSPLIFGTSPHTITQDMVLKMAETLVYSGIDDEHKQLGAMYFLTGITIVSQSARNQMPWLYENFFSMVP